MISSAFLLCSSCSYSFVIHLLSFQLQPFSNTTQPCLFENNIKKGFCVM